MRKYLVTEELLQTVLNALGKARVDAPLAELVGLVDTIRNLQPQPQTAEEAAAEAAATASTTETTSTEEQAS